MPNIFYANCTAIHSHIGCLAVTDAHIRGLLESGFNIKYLYHTYQTRFLRHENRSEALKIAQESSLVSELNQCDALVINGEGSIHHHGGRDLLCLTEIAQNMGLKTYIINAVIQDVDGYDDVLLKLNDLTVRENFSANYLETKNIPCRVIADSLIDADFYKETDNSYQDKIICTDWQPQRDYDVGMAKVHFIHQNQDNSSFVYLPFEHHSYAVNNNWRYIVSKFEQAKLIVTGRHHAMYVAGLSGVPFVAMPSNTWKIEGAIALSGLPLPLCNNKKELESHINFALSNPSIFQEYRDFLRSVPKYSVFEQLKKDFTHAPQNKHNIIDKKVSDYMNELFLQSHIIDSQINFKNACGRIKKEAGIIKQQKEVLILKQQIKTLETQISVLNKGGMKRKAPEINKNFELALTEYDYKRADIYLKSYLSLYPYDHDALYRYGLNMIMTDDVIQGMKLLHHRSYITGFYPKNNFHDNTPVWNGEDFDGRLVIYSSEGPGVGTEIMLFYFLNDIIKLHPDHIVTCSPDMLHIWKRSFPHIRFCGYNDIGVNGRNLIKRHCCVFSLPFLYFTYVEKNFPDKKNSYLIADKSKTEKYHNLYSLSKKTTVGISWFTTNQKSQNIRSVPFDVMLEIFKKNQHIHFISLQHGLTETEKESLDKYICLDNQNPIQEKDDLMAQIQAVDYVISIDNSVAFMAAAMNKKCFLLLPYYSNWPWEIVKKYPQFMESITIIQQNQHENWSNIINKLDEILTNAHRFADV